MKKKNKLTSLTKIGSEIFGSGPYIVNATSNFMGGGTNIFWTDPRVFSKEDAPATRKTCTELSYDKNEQNCDATKYFYDDNGNQTKPAEIDNICK